MVDSDTLPLSVSRETLQAHASLKTIKKKIVRKLLDMFKKMAETETAEGAVCTRLNLEKCNTGCHKGALDAFSGATRVFQRPVGTAAHALACKIGADAAVEH